MDPLLLFLLAFTLFGVALGTFLFNEKLEMILQVERLMPLRWFSGGLLLFVPVLLALGVAALFV